MRGVTGHQVTTWGKRVDQRGHEMPGRVGSVNDVVDGHQDQADRPREIQRAQPVEVAIGGAPRHASAKENSLHHGCLVINAILRGLPRLRPCTSKGRSLGFRSWPRT